MFLSVVKTIILTIVAEGIRNAFIHRNGIISYVTSLTEPSLKDWDVDLTRYSPVNAGESKSIWTGQQFSVIAPKVSKTSIRMTVRLILRDWEFYQELEEILT